MRQQSPCLKKPKRTLFPKLASFEKSPASYNSTQFPFSGTMTTKKRLHHHPPIFLPLSLLALLLRSQAQSNGYNCSADRTIYPCRSYAFYRAASEPELASVGDLFGVSRLMISKASNLSLTSSIHPGDSLLIPLPCSCGASSNLSYAPVSYQIVAGDTFYGVSTYKFQNLTAYPAVEIVNPALVPTDLEIGVEVVFPLFCQCPSRNETVNGVQALVTYVRQPSDSYRSIASRFGSDEPSLVSLNGPEGTIKPFATLLVPISHLPPPLFSDRRNSSTPPSSHSINDRKVQKRNAVVGLAIAVGIMGFLWVLMIFALVWFWRRRRRWRGEAKKRKEYERGEKQQQLGGFRPSGEYLMADISELLDRYRVYDIEMLNRATSDFDRSRLIQGSVYKGLIDAAVFAIKKMKWDARDELKILQKVNHSNLVKLEGFCINPEANDCYLVYEYVVNGSLHSWLHTTTRPHKLDWKARLRVALDLANGLQYIHEHTWPRVVHKDIKSSNVLLDAKFRAKIANFGLARTGCNAVTTHIVGTQGYVAPEYVADGIVTTKVDVFAYGVILLELVSGREAMSESGKTLWMDMEVVFGWGEVKSDGRLRLWMDAYLLEQLGVSESVVNVMNMARACLNRDPSKRPSMVDVAYMLSKVDDLNAEFSDEGPTVVTSQVRAR